MGYRMAMAGMEAAKAAGKRWGGSKRGRLCGITKEQVEAIEALREEISENPQLAEEERAELLEPITSALEGLDQAELTQEGAVATLSEAEADLRELATQYSTESLRQALQTAGEPLAENPISPIIMIAIMM